MPVSQVHPHQHTGTGHLLPVSISASSSLQAAGTVPLCPTGPAAGMMLLGSPDTGYPGRDAGVLWCPVGLGGSLGSCMARASIKTPGGGS